MKISSVCYACFLALLANAIAQQPTPVVTATATSTPASSPATSPIASQRRGRLLVPDGTPTPSAPAAVTTTSTPTQRPAEIVEPTLIPTRPAPPGSRSQQPVKRGQFESMAQKFNPHKVQPMPSKSPSSASTPSLSPAGKPSKPEKRELKDEGKRGSESAVPSPSATP
jgi:hypothetical protein